MPDPDVRALVCSDDWEELLQQRGDAGQEMGWGPGTLSGGAVGRRRCGFGVGASLELQHVQGRPVQNPHPYKTPHAHALLFTAFPLPPSTYLLDEPNHPPRIHHPPTCPSLAAAPAAAAARPARHHPTCSTGSSAPDVAAPPPPPQTSHY